MGESLCESCRPLDEYKTFYGIFDLMSEVMADQCEEWHEEKKGVFGGHNRKDRPVDCFCWDVDAFLLMTDDEMKERGVYFLLKERDLLYEALRHEHRFPKTEDDGDEILTEFLVGLARNQNTQLVLERLPQVS